MRVYITYSAEVDFGDIPEENVQKLFETDELSLFDFESVIEAVEITS